MKEYNGLIDRVGWIATEYFTDLPPKALDVSYTVRYCLRVVLRSGYRPYMICSLSCVDQQDPVSTFDRSSKAMAGFSGFVQIPISGSEYSRVLRLAIVQHIIFNAICDPVWQRFYSVYVGNVKREQMLLPKIYARAQVQGEAVQQHWKVSTLRALDLLDESADVGMVIQELIDQRIVAALKYLLDFERLDRFKTDLRNVFYDAFKMGRMAWIDQSPVIYSINPSVSDHVGWKEFWGEAEEMKDTAEPAPTSPVADSPRTEPLFVSPKIYRRVVRTATTSTATTSAATVGAGQREEEIIRPGYALFPDTGIFQLGAWDWRRIRNAGREAARGINGSGRAMSMSTSGPAAGSGPGLSSPTFPQVPSKKWSPEGAPDFD